MKKQRPLEKEYLSPHLYREDLEDIEKIIKEDLQPKDYKISFCEYEYKTISEIPASTPPSKDFQMNSSLPSIYINLAKHSRGIRTYSDNTDLKTAGVFAKIDQVISLRDRRITLIWIKSSRLLAVLFYVVCIFFMTIKNFSPRLAVVDLVVGTLAIFLWFLSFYSYPPKVDFFYKRERGSFFERNKDQIFLSVISAIVGMVLTIVATLLLKI